MNWGLLFIGVLVLLFTLHAWLFFSDGEAHFWPWFLMGLSCVLGAGFGLLLRATTNFLGRWFL